MILSHPNRNWTLFSSLWQTTNQFFTSRRDKLKLLLLLLLGASITLAELVTVHSFGRLIEYLTAPVNDPFIPVLVFLIAFTGVRVLSYFHSLLKIKLLDHCFSKRDGLSAQTNTWRWPTGIALIMLLTALARLAIIIGQSLAINLVFGLTFIGIFFLSWLFTSRMSQKQYDIHTAFLLNRNTPEAASPSTRVRTRVFAGEANSLRVFFVIPPLLLILAYLVHQQLVSSIEAIILFFSLRIISSIMHVISTSSTQYVRAYVYIEEELTAVGEDPETSFHEPSDRSSSSLTKSGESMDAENVSQFMRTFSVSLPPTQLLAQWLEAGNTYRHPREFRDSSTSNPEMHIFAEPSPKQLHVSSPLIHWRVLRVADKESAIEESMAVAQDLFSGYLVPLGQINLSESIGSFHNRALKTLRSHLSDDVDHGEISLHPAHDFLTSSLSRRQLATFLGIQRTLSWISDSMPQGDSGHEPLAVILTGLRDNSNPIVDWLKAFSEWFNSKFYNPDRGYFTPTQLAFSDPDELVAHRTATLGEQRIDDHLKNWMFPSAIRVSPYAEQVDRVYPVTSESDSFGEDFEA